MQGTLGFFVFILGAIIGSFLNVVILRTNTGASLHGRSRCFTCGLQLRWYDLFPIASYIFLRGRCRSCKSSISRQYVIVEILTGLLFLGTYLKIGPSYGNGAISIPEAIARFPWGILALYWAIWSLFVVIAIYDLRHKIIPDFFLSILIALALFRIVAAILIENVSFVETIKALSVGPLLALPLLIIWYFSSGRAMGFGDVKLAFAMGLFLSVKQAIAVFVLSFWIGGAISIILLVATRIARLCLRKNVLNLRCARVTMKSEIPFAPFLVAGIAVVFFFSIDIFSVLSVFEKLWL